MSQWERRSMSVAAVREIVAEAGGEVTSMQAFRKHAENSHAPTLRQTQLEQRRSHIVGSKIDASRAVRRHITSHTLDKGTLVNDNNKMSLLEPTVQPDGPKGVVEGVISALTVGAALGVVLTDLSLAARDSHEWQRRIDEVNRAEAQRKRLAAEAEAKRRAAEAERQKAIAFEAKRKQMLAEAEAHRKRVAAEAERRRLQEEARKEALAELKRREAERAAKNQGKGKSSWW